MSKERLDTLLVAAGLAASREQAQCLIRAGEVTVDGVLADKPGHRFDTAAALAVKEGRKYASRGGYKLEGAFEAFHIDVNGLVCVDVGASTGGFTDCLLQRGAAHVYAVDVGKGLLDWRLRNDPRVSVHEGVNARYLEAGAFQPPPDFGVVDVSFISLVKVLPAVRAVMASRFRLVTLIKPQFEAGRADVGKGGVVRSEAARERVVDEISRFAEGPLALRRLGVAVSPLKGPAGNVEYLAYWEGACF